VHISRSVCWVLDFQLVSEALTFAHERDSRPISLWETRPLLISSSHLVSLVTGICNLRSVGVVSLCRREHFRIWHSLRLWAYNP
jgi:hypothetical protein